MSRRLELRSVAFVLAAAALSACAVGPDFQRPEAPASTGYSPAPLADATVSAPGPQGAAQHLEIGGAVRRDWWTLFGSKELDALVERAFAANPTIEAASATLRAAQENVAAQRGYFYPTVQAGYSFARTKQSATVPASNAATPAEVAPSSIYNFHTAQLTVGYAPDVFGGNRRQSEALQAEANAQRFELGAAYITLASNVVAAAVEDAMLRSQIAIVQDMLQSSEQSIAIVRRQWKAGALSRLDVALQETELSQTRQLLPPLRKQFEQNRNLLRALVGAGQDAEIPAFDLDTLKLPPTLPVSLPSQLVEQRPDIRAAEEQLRAASAQVGVARSARLPQFSISADAGGGAMQIAELFYPGGRFFSMLAGVTQSVFDAGTLQHREAAAQALHKQAAAQYRSTVVTALQNVADALHAVHADAEMLLATSEAARNSDEALELTRRQYGHGYLDRVALINAEQNVRQAQLTLTQARAARLGDCALLLQALGGGWWESDESARVAQP